MKIKTSCHFCSSRCGMLLRIEDKQIKKVEGDPEHPVSRGWTCSRGRAASAQRYHHAHMI